MHVPRIIVCWTVVVLALAGRASADGVMRDSVGAISSGRGGTNIAHADNAAVLLSNPAGLVNFHGGGLFEIGADTLVTELDYTDPWRNSSAKAAPFVLPQLGLVHKSPHGNWAAGVGVFVPTGFSAEWEMDGPFPIGGQQQYRSLGAQVKILPGAAYRLTDRLSVGATLGVAVSRTELDGPFFMQSGPLQGTPTVLDMHAHGAALTWSVGLQYLLSERTTLGMVYTSETRHRLKGQADADVFTPFGIIPSHFDAEVDLVWPQSVGVGITHLATERQRLSADVLWFNWSRAFDRLDMTLSNASDPLLAAGGPISDSLPLDWDDTVSVRLGYEYLHSPCDVLRLGYAYTSRAIPGSTLTPYIPGILEHMVSAGYGKQWGHSRIDLAYQFAFGSTRHVPQSDVVGGEFDRSNIRARAHWLFLSYTHQF